MHFGFEWFHNVNVAVVSFHRLSILSDEPNGPFLPTYLPAYLPTYLVGKTTTIMDERDTGHLV